MDFKITEIKERVLADNDEAAARTKERMRQNGTLLVNLMGSPGAGKTSVLLQLIERLGSQYRIGVMEADVDSDVDAQTIAATGTRVIQIHTGGLCHMDADMAARALASFGIEDLDLIFLENIGNLVCPAEFEIGADVRMMILSVPEGDDKPLKYPLMFTVTDCLLINKIDCASIVDFDIQKCRKNVEPLNPDVPVMPLSAKTGEGVDGWISWLEEKINTSKRMEK